MRRIRVISKMWFKYIRQVSAFILIILGAVLGIAAVYIAPSTSNFTGDKRSKLKKNKESQNPKVIVQDPNNNIVNAEMQTTNNQIQYGESTVLDIINIIKSEISNYFDCTGIKMFIPDAECSNTTSNYEDADSKFATISTYTTATEVSTEYIDPVPETSTIYNKLPNEGINAPSVQKIRVTNEIHDIYSGTKTKVELNNPPGQSTLIDSNGSENVKRGFIVSFKNNKSPIRRIFKKMINLLRFKNNLSQNTNSTPKTSSTCLHNGDYNNKDITLYF